MCKAFFKFYPEPTRIDCKFVKAKWVKECNLRVDLVKQEAAKQWIDAAVTRNELDGIKTISTPKPTPKRVVKVDNPYMKLYGDYNLTKSEALRVQKALERMSNERV